MNSIGYFKPTDKRIDTIKYANWGSRPYEYSWVTDIINELNIPNMKVIDLGTGNPSLHGWPGFFKNNFKFDSYVGIDFLLDENEKIDSETFKLIPMDMTKIEYPDNTFNLGLCISTFEHFRLTSDLIKAFKEVYRVLDNDAYLIVTLDEIWDCTQKILPNFWNLLDFSMREDNYSFSDGIGFGIKDFLNLIKPYFLPLEPIVNLKTNADKSLLYNDYYNDAISYCVLKKRTS